VCVLSLAQVFEVNNAVAHLVHNRGNVSRIHLVMDVAEAPLPPPLDLQPGQTCWYRESGIEC
jgi:hypothetical protein